MDLAPQCVLTWQAVGGGAPADVNLTGAAASMLRASLPASTAPVPLPCSLAMWTRRLTASRSRDLPSGCNCVAP